MPYEDVLVHTATPLLWVTGPNWIEGEPDENRVPGTPFACCLFLPLPGQAQPRRGRRVVSVPTLLLATHDLADSPVDVRASDELDITAPELPPPWGGPDPVRWQVEGDPQPFGPPGEDLVGMQVALKRVED